MNDITLNDVRLYIKNKNPWRTDDQVEDLLNTKLTAFGHKTIKETFEINPDFVMATLMRMIN